MGSGAVDSSQWLSVKEETIFLHDGLIRVTDLAELPSEIGVSEQGDTEQEILTFETKNPVELAERLRAVCGNQSNAYARLLEYRLNALRGLWGAQRQLALEEQQERDGTGGADEETLALLKRQGLLQQPEQAPFTSRVGLLLVFPLLQSQTRSDPALCGVTAEVLLACLRDCQPLSLSKEPADCLNGLEGLLCSWLEDGAQESGHPQVLHTHRQRENAAAALVALACARGSLKTFIHTVHLLQKQTDLGQLPVSDVLYRLLLLEGGPGSPSCLLGGKHSVSWGFEDMLPTPDNSAGAAESKDTDLGRCLATDGLYLYTTNSSGRGLSKLGSGLHGTLRGFVYCRNEELEPGWVVVCSGRLLHRPSSFDAKPHQLCQVIDPFTLQVCQIVPMPVHHFPVGSSMTTLHLCSDGTYLYWTQTGLCVADILQERVILTRKEGESSKCLNELLLSRMSRFRASHSATLAALTGSAITNTTLRKTPMYVCGTYLVMLVSPPGVSGSSATRSLFGGTSSLSSLKILASSLVFSLADGQFSSRADLIDAPGSSLGRGAQVAGLGACYDALNNLIWTCSSDYIDQWCNPGNQAFHHVCHRLGVSHVIKEPKEETVATGDVINQLLHHVGAMCIHQLNLLAASSNSLPLGALLGKQHPIEARHFSSICDIMEKAMSEQNRESVRRSGLLLWQLLMAPVDQIGAEIQKEVCLAIRNSGLSHLRDVILTNLADQLQKNRFGSEEDDHYRLSDELLHCILKTVVRESCLVITKCQTVVSPSLRYLMAVQNHLLSNTVLIRPDDNDDSDSSLQGETMKELQCSILSLATKILVGCDEVLETLQQVTTALINSDIADRETRPSRSQTPSCLSWCSWSSTPTALLLKTQSPLFTEEPPPIGGSSETGAKACAADDKILDEREEPGFLTGLKIPAPWAAGKTVDTVHPVRDNYKFKETLVIYAGPNTNSRKVTEYGGNTLGYGSRSVEGDTVTFSFEMRSGREHNTPDKAMWGFSCTESSEDVSGGLPFLADLALGLSVLACSMLRILYNGPEVEANGAISPALTPSPSPLPLTIEEDREFTYPSDVLIPPPGLMPGTYFDLPRIRLPPGIMGRLREVSGRARPQFRPSIKDVIRPDVMEEVIVSCVIKHLSLMDALQSLVNYQYREDHAEEYDLVCKIMVETFKKINSMERQLQSVAELEQKWQNENKIKELELLCSLKEVPLDFSDLENKFFQEVNTTHLRSSTTLAKTKALVKSLMNRTELLLHSVSDAKTVIPMVKQPVFLRSMSAPSDLEMIANQDLEFTHAPQRRRHHPTSHRSSSFTLLQSLAVEDSRDKPTSSFLSAAQTRWRRGSTRKQALVHMRELLTAAVRVGGVTHLVGPVTMVLQGGPRIEELTCGGMVEQVQEAFGETMTSVLMDSLCSLSGQRECSSNEKQTRKQKVATMAWAAFQVLANRCIEWEKVEGGSTDAVHSGLARQVSSLLTNHLARATESHIGKAILSQPACVSKLLSLLLDQRPSPKLVLIILQLCRAALPLMSVEDCGNVALPSWSYSINTLDAEQQDARCQTLLSPSSSEPDTSLSRTSSKGALKSEDVGEEGEAVDGKLSIFIHKRDDQSSHEVLQPLLSGSCEVITEEASAALRKANKWAQSGLIVSVGPPVETVAQEAAGGITTGDKKKTAQTAVCRDRNADLARSDPVRPFISGHVANSMAAEVIALLHSLLTAPESNTAQIWTSTAEKVLSRALMFIPQLGKYAESILENGSSSGRKLAKLQAIGRQAVVGKGVLGSVGIVISINEQEGIATVRFPCGDYRRACQASDTLTVPISRLCTPRSEVQVSASNTTLLISRTMSASVSFVSLLLPTYPRQALPLYKLSITEKVVQAVQSMLLPHEGSLSIHTSLPATGDGSSPVMAAVRLLAEIRTRACLVMAQLLEDSSFCEEFIQQCPAAVEVLNLVAQECCPGCCTGTVPGRRPPPCRQTDPKEITWCPSRVFPPVRACMFSSRLTSVTFLADPSAGGGLPRGTFIYATCPVPIQAEKRDGAWTNPVGTCLFHNNGRAVHYNGSSLLQWKSVRLDVALLPGDVAGIGWERSEGTPPPPGQAPKGRVYFTYCGQRLGPILEDVAGGMWPLNSKIRANFGSRPFAYAEGQAHRNAADLCVDLAEEISANFEALPFAMASDSDNDAGASVTSDSGSHGPPCRIAAVAVAQQQYNSDLSCHYKFELSYENLVTSGPDPHPPPIADDEMFPTIRRRFRNEAERKSGLDQIKGALQLGGTALPKFAIRGMLKTFGLHGVVLDVDSVNELVQVETYLRSEGVLVRYWYPIEMLERPPAGSRRTAANGLVSLDSSNIQIHRELLRCESALARLYCRMALLNIFAPKSPHTFTRLFHIPAIRDITLEHLQLLSNQLLAPPLPDGTISSSSILLAQSVLHNLQGQSCSPSELFYQGNAQPIQEWLTVAITRALHQGEESLLELTKQICCFLQNAPEQFTSEEFPVTESKVSMDVSFPGAAFVIVSCKESQLGCRKDSSLYKAPWARVMVYGLGHKVRRNGQLNLMEAMCYPLDASPTNTGLTPPPTTNQYPSFPLAMAFAEQLLTWKLGENGERSEDELDTLLRKIHHLEQRKSPAGLSSSIALLLNPCLAVLMALQTELRKLYDRETQGWTAGGAGAGGSSSGGVALALGTDQSRFSTYFHALMEVCLAVAEVTLPLNVGGSSVGALSSTSAPNLSDSSSSSSSSPGQTPQSPSLLSKRKKVKMKRERAAAAVAAAVSGKRGSGGARLSESDSALLNMAASKPEDMLWFHRGLTLLMILRHLTNKDPQGLSVTSDAVTDACQALVGPTAHSRLLVLSGIPTHLEEAVVRNAIRRACNAHGGLFKDEVFIPLQEEDPKKPKAGAGVSSPQDGKAGSEPERPFPNSGVPESPDSSSSVTPAMSVSASASTSQTSICSSSQGVSRTASELSVDQEPSAGPPLTTTTAAAAASAITYPQQGPQDTQTVSSQESLDTSLCSTGSLGSLGSLGEPLDSSETPSASDGGSMHTVTSLESNAVVRSRAKVEKIRASLFNSSDLIGLSSLDGEEDLMELTNEEILTASSVNQSLFDTQGSSALEDYFLDKSVRGDKLVPGARDVLTDIFKSCVHSEQMLSLTPAKPVKVSDIYLSKEQINAQTPGNLLHTFFTNVRPPKKVLEDQLTQILRKYGTPKPNKNKYSKAGKEQHQGKKKTVLKPKSPEKSRPDEKDVDKSPAKKAEVPEEKYLTLEGFHKFAVDRAKQDIRSVWRAILACGYDLHLERCTCIDTRHAQKACRKWNLEMDVALVQYVNRLCRHLAITPARLHPHEVYLDPGDAADPRVACLLNVPVESMRLRFALLQSLNNTLESFFLPLVELRQTHTYQNSIAALLCEAKGLNFYDTKVTVMNRVLNATVQRTADHAAPEITLDPLEIVGGEIRSSENTYFCQAARQLACVPSSQLCVKLASGGDPTYAFNIRFTGEEVCKELQSSALSLLLPCPSAAANRNKGKYILTPCPISYAEEQLLHFFGQLLGIAIRADVPLPLDLLGSFWKGLAGDGLDPEQDLQEADVLTYNYVKKFENASDETELEALCAEISSQHHSGESPDSPSRPCCTFTYVTMTGEEVELC
ncbi:hypothetical protein FQN60_005319, partial [Etheostoma spectabile]